MKVTSKKVFEKSYENIRKCCVREREIEKGKERERDES
jgi:hypothetical protein